MFTRIARTTSSLTDRKSRITRIRKRMFGSRFLKWIEGSSDEEMLVRIPFSNIIVRTSEEVVRSHLKFGGVVLVFCGALVIAHHDAKRMMKANSIPGPTFVRTQSGVNRESGVRSAS